MNRKPLIAGLTVGSILGIALIAAIGYGLYWAHHRLQRPAGTFSRKALLDMARGSSTGHDFKFVVDRTGHPILLGEGGYGEVIVLPCMCCKDLAQYFALSSSQL